MTTRRITFHVLKMRRMDNPDVLYNMFDFQAFTDWFNLKSDDEKIFHISDNKFTSLDYLEKIPNRLITSHPFAFFGMMSTGNHGSRRNLKNSLNNTRRANPKLIEEGEEQENYFILAFKSNGNIEMVFQNAGRGIKTVHIKNYLDKFFNQYLTSLSIEKEFTLIEGAVVSTADVMINRLERVTKTKVFIDKEILGKNDLDLSERTIEARDEIIIDVRARRGMDIRDTLQDIRQRIVHNTKIDKIWIEGKDNYGNISSFYLSKIQKSTSVMVEIDPATAALVQTDMRKALIKLL